MKSNNEVKLWAQRVVNLEQFGDRDREAARCKRRRIFAGWRQLQMNRMEATAAQHRIEGLQAFLARAEGSDRSGRMLLHLTGVNVAH
jgi:hypothetical protein